MASFLSSLRSSQAVELALKCLVKHLIDSQWMGVTLEPLTVLQMLPARYLGKNVEK